MKDDGNLYRIYSDGPFTNENFLQILDGLGGLQLEPIVRTVNGANPYAEIHFSARTVQITGSPNPQNCSFVYIPETGGVTGTYPGTNMRHNLGLGVSDNAVALFASTNQADFDVAWDERFGGPMERLIAAHPQAFQPMPNGLTVQPKVNLKMKWRDLLLNDNVQPSDADAANLLSPAYRMGGDPGGTGFNPLEAIRAKLQAMGGHAVLLIGDTASGGHNIQPRWFINAGHAWQSEADHRLYYSNLADPAAFEHTVRFFKAVADAASTTPEFSIGLNEYYFNNTAPDPNPHGWTLQLGRTTRRDLWNALRDSFPVDSDGNRMMTYQATFQTSAGDVQTQDVIDAGFGMGIPDPDLFHHGIAGTDYVAEVDTISGRMQQMAGQGPTVFIGDSREFTAQFRGPIKSFNWNGTNTPLNLSGNQLVTHRQTMWYYGVVVPCSDYFFDLESDVTEADVHAAVAEFGPNGTARDPVTGEGGAPTYITAPTA